MIDLYYTWISQVNIHIVSSISGNLVASVLRSSLNVIGESFVYFVLFSKEFFLNINFLSNQINKNITHKINHLLAKINSVNIYTVRRGIWNGSVECHIQLAASNNGFQHGFFCFWIFSILRFCKTNGCFVRNYVAVIILEMIDICLTEIKFLPQQSTYVHFHMYNDFCLDAESQGNPLKDNTNGN